MVTKLLLLIFIIGTYLNAASVKATVNTKEVVKGNTVQLTIKASGTSAAFPKIREINGVSVRDSGTSTSTSTSITVNGMKRESTTIKKYIFTPKHDMTIPSYTVRIGSETLKTEPIKIKVVQSKPSTAHHSNKGYSFVMKSSKDTMVVGESFVITLYLSLEERLGVQQVSDYVEPASTGFFFKDLGKQKQYKRGNASVIEKQYSVTAKKEGSFTISSASAKVGITDKGRQDLFGRYGIRWIAVVSNNITLKVNAQKIETDLVGNFTINSKIDQQKVKINKPVNLTISIKGEGNLEEFEFPKYEIDGVTIYEDEAKVVSSIRKGKLISTYSKNFAFIAEESFVIPKRSISSYNTKLKKVKILKIPSFDIEIEKKKMPASISPATPPPSAKHIHNPSEIKRVENYGKHMSWWMLALAFVAGMLVMYLLRFVPQILKTKENPYKESEALKILYAHISKDKAVEEMVYKLYARKNGDKSVHIDRKELKEMISRFI
jgi:hypothetical protein